MSINASAEQFVTMVNENSRPISKGAQDLAKILGSYGFKGQVSLTLTVVIENEHDSNANMEKTAAEKYNFSRR